MERDKYRGGQFLLIHYGRDQAQGDALPMWYTQEHVA